MQIKLPYGNSFQILNTDEFDPPLNIGGRYKCSFSNPLDKNVITAKIIEFSFQSESLVSVKCTSMLCNWAKSAQVSFTFFPIQSWASLFRLLRTNTP